MSTRKPNPLVAYNWSGNGLRVMSRCLDESAVAILKAQLSSLTWYVWNITDGLASAVAVDSGTFVVATSWYDTLQTTDDAWTVDATGFNFSGVIPAANFLNTSVEEQIYRIEIWATPVSGDDFPVAIVEQTTGRALAKPLVS